ncbi:LPXTG-motif cell wall anchor domain-containing protein [Sarcina sp. DSM 11001]|uniref:hemoblobin-interacting domain-containing protein n=1 Tax=Sarcina sp. DSM 11001 TaxID=1798184 RepID=UPI00088A5EEA|nr:LPXTG cell wall anchor domain-containing protein [Sarcina sp. DSM 11001]SDM02273.1 LPXTG-motif cell wall anchor domain-containing protein [Sarcina sp. DSM 11001]
MREHSQSRIIISLLLGLILLALCLPVCAFAEDAEFSDGDEAGISLVTAVPPNITSGGGAEYRDGSTEGLTFKTDDAKDNLLRVLVDGKVISSDKYTVSGEPLTITLHADYLNTLSEGEHTIEIVTTNGSAFATFIVRKENTQPQEKQDSVRSSTSPATGDESNVGVYAALMMISLAAIFVLFIFMRKTKRRL